MGFYDRVMIACVVLDRPRIVEAVKFYRVDRVYLIHYVTSEGHGSEGRGDVFESFYKAVESDIKEIGTGIEVIEYPVEGYSFADQLKSVQSIVEEEDALGENPVIYVNISAGPPEYISAATIISMMHENVRPFSVAAADYLYNDAEKMRQIYYLNDEPLGLITEVKEPVFVQKFDLDAPDRRLVRGLRILQERTDAREDIRAVAMIDALKEAGLWRRNDAKGEQVYYTRDFIDKWIENGWVERDSEMKKRLLLTDKGRLVLHSFYLADEISKIVLN